MTGIDKAPRWFLTIIISAALGISWLSIGAIVKNAFADMEKVKSVCSTASNLSSENQKDIGLLTQSIDKILIMQETSRKEYREDRKEDAVYLRNMKAEIIAAVKS